MDISHYKGFSFIEVILVLTLSSIVILIFIQNINLSHKFLNTNPQVLFNNDDIHLTGRGLQATSDFVFADLSNSLGKRDCSIENLESFNNIVIPPYQNLNHGEVVAMSVFGNTLVAGLNSATSSDPDLVTVDTNNWTLIKSLNTGPGLAGMALQGHYLYLANTSVNSQFQVVDVLNSSLIASLKIPGSISSNSKRNPVVTSISSTATNDGKARIYIGTQKSDLGEIFIADFNGTNLSFITAYDTGSVVNDVFANSTGLWATSPSDDELFHYNSSGTKDYVFNANGQSGNGKRIDILSQDFKMLGRTYGHEELIQIDGPAKKIGGSINDLLVNVYSGKVHVLLLTSISGVPVLQTWDIVDGKLERLLKSIVLPVPANRMACGEKSIFIGTSSSSLPFLTLTQ